MQNIDVRDYKSVVKFIKLQMKSGVSFENTMKLLGYVRKEYNPPNVDACVKQKKDNYTIELKNIELEDRVKKLENRITLFEKRK